MAGSVVQLLSLMLLALLAANAPPIVCAEDKVAASRPLSGDGMLVSRGGKFALGFFQPDRRAVRGWYVGIWYHNILVRTPVWVANRDRPVSDPAASLLTIAADGNLVLLDLAGSRVWSTNASAAAGYAANNANATAVLLDTGNLVLAPSSNASNVLWQSFDHIGDTWLPGARLRRDMITGVIQGMTSWRALGDPAPGPYTLQFHSPADAPQYVLLWNGTREYYRAPGDWTRRIFSFDGRYSIRFADDGRESYFTYGFADNSTTVFFRFVLDVSGQMLGLLWVEAQGWILVYMEPRTRCQVPRACGAFGVCSGWTFDTCHCVRGFSPRDAVTWDLRDYTGGCVRNSELQCGDLARRLKAREDTFFTMLSTRLPDNGRVGAGGSSSAGCKRACLADCTCSAYMYNDSCILWHGDLQNLGDTYLGPGTGTLYLRLAAPELTGARSHNKRRTVLVAIFGALTIVCLVVTASVLKVRRTTTARRRETKVQGLEGSVAAFDYRELQSFTNNFSDRLGGGSFGSVFRGQLSDRNTMIAVKKLEGGWQGEKQFRAEVSTLGSIHHVNLIRLLGFCSDGSGHRNKLLVYEYMPNGSLDRRLFNGALSWCVRYQIAVGVAKGLSYLHHKCRDCIIHCDVKPENILLDADFVPKVADFGLAKLMGRDFSRVLTTMRGTIGYLAPEWIGGESITPKADVYSYGMMLFEIVSEKRNIVEDGKTESRHERSSSTDYAGAEFFPVMAARRLADSEGDITALLDPALGSDLDAEEVRRVCKVACWCIQDEVDARPTMAEVVRVLEGMTEIQVPPVPRYLEVLAGRWMYATDHDYNT